MFFDAVPESPPDAVFGMMGTFHADARSQKVNLMVGIYKDEHLKSELMPAVRTAKERALLQDLQADYLPFDGPPAFIDLLGKLVFGEQMWAAHQTRIYGAQSVGGTGALRLGADFLVKEVGANMWVPQPTWANHRGVFEKAGMKVESLRYYNPSKHCFDFEECLAHLRSLPAKSAVLFHAACHNPTGSDPTFEQWREISDVCKQRSLIPFFDFAYQGFGDGVEEDAKAVRLFLEQGHELLIAYSCSKNFSLYCQRVGAIFAVCKDSTAKTRVGSQIKRIIRTNYSNPPAHGPKIVIEILSDEKLHKQWLSELRRMKQRIERARENFVHKLMAKAKNKNFDFVRRHKGMFSYLDLDKSQVQTLIDRYAIYTLDSGRINVAGLTDQNTDAVVNAILAVCDA